MERLYKGFEIIKNHFHTSNQQRPNFESAIAVLITVYCPDPNKWINWRIRKKD
ncbi:MAG: hypothetical protein HEQ13_15645 [Dolichospermum sp. DEX189]|jgi:hypothetical protein|uniref:hypothetical protein n=1 Tax=Dolichospermum sp. LEGE 00246 TaxID=1828605 RepID=UPI0004B414D7|nr:hypothetical protein [Dolichospermum sp. LEGE 00246]MBE9256705.1 hypothetical protein [Dolichospermum sp. LEGE 00246]MBO1070704.1 hypothetical protein [Dolichospermum sp. DEX189]MDK2409512.1 hypothetical protein [Aphanizomenon sp. 202]MDK2460580.1 hypothetical protein [Aphanizomenon sp. PH219]